MVRYVGLVPMLHFTTDVCRSELDYAVLQSAGIAAGDPLLKDLKGYDDSDGL